MRALLSIATRSSPLARARRAVSARDDRDGVSYSCRQPTAFRDFRRREFRDAKLPDAADSSAGKAFESGCLAFPRFSFFFFRDRDVTLVWAFGQTRFRRNSGIFPCARDGEKGGRRSAGDRAAALRPERTLERPHASRIGRSLSRTHTHRGPRETLAHRRIQREVGRPSRWGTPSTRRMKSSRRLDKAPTARCTRPGREPRADSWR